MKVHHTAAPRGPVSHLGGVHNPNATSTQPQAGTLGKPGGVQDGSTTATDNIASQLAAITSMKAQ